MRTFFNYIVTNFGFSDCSDFLNSFLHFNLMNVTLPIVGISAFIEKYFGLEHLTIMSFGLLMILELVTGLMASKIKKVKIESKKFGRFGLKVLVWFSLIFITNSLSIEYKSHKDVIGSMAHAMFNWVHTFLFIYINMEYLISILENLGVITGNKKNSKNLIKIMMDNLFSTFKK
jgi:hypothetical protein